MGGDDDDDDDNDESCCSECKYGTGERKLLMDSWKLPCVCKLCRIHWFTSQTDLIRSHTSSQYRLEMAAIFGGGWERDGLILQISVNVFVCLSVCQEYIEFSPHTAVLPFKYTVNLLKHGPGSSVGIGTGYGLDGPGIESRWGVRFSASVQTDPGAHPASCTIGTGSFPGVKSGRGVTLTPHPLLVPLVMKE
jgi:hypothetical protein